MSWQAGDLRRCSRSSLVGGFAWYERSRPPLAGGRPGRRAGGAGGRRPAGPRADPERRRDDRHRRCSPATRSAAAPGFAVGALAAPISNIWLGQGPWTPWQMAGWGLAGSRGAGARDASAGRGWAASASRVACGLAGFAYGALLDLSVMVTYGGEQSLDRYLALSARGDAVQRRPRRRQLRDRARRRPGAGADDLPLPRAASSSAGVRPGALPLALAALVAARSARSGARPTRAPPPAHAAGRGLARARRRTPTAASRRRPGQPSSAAMTGWAMLGLEAAGATRSTSARGGDTPVDYLRGDAGGSRSAGDLERTILALEGAGLDSRALRGPRPRRASCASQRRRDGSCEGQVNLTAFGVLALRAAGAERRRRSSADWLRGAQNADGGWGFAPGAAERRRLDRRGAAGAAPPRAPAARCDRRRRLPARRQQRDGGWSLARAASSTRSRPRGRSRAWSRPAPPRGRSSAGRSPSTTSPRLQAADGHYRYSARATRPRSGSPPRRCWRSSARPFPLAPVPRRAAGAVGDGSSGGSGGGAGAARRRPGCRPGARRRAAPMRRRGASGGEGRTDGGGGAAIERRNAGPGAGSGGRPRRAARPTGAGGAASPIGRPGTESAERDGPAGERRRPIRAVGADCTTGRLLGGRPAARSRSPAAGCAVVPPRLADGRRRLRVVGDGRRDRDPHPPHAQGVPARAGRRARRSTSCSSSPAGRRTTT